MLKRSKCRHSLGPCFSCHVPKGSQVVSFPASSTPTTLGPAPALRHDWGPLPAGTTHLLGQALCSGPVRDEQATSSLWSLPGEGRKAACQGALRRTLGGSGTGSGEERFRQCEQNSSAEALRRDQALFIRQAPDRVRETVGTQADSLSRGGDSGNEGRHPGLRAGMAGTGADTLVSCLQVSYPSKTGVG